MLIAPPAFFIFPPGTLTLSRMAVTALWLPPDTSLDVTGHGLAPDGALVLRSTGERVGKPEGGLADLLTVASLCNTATVTRGTGGSGEWVGVGDATEVALTVRACCSVLDLY